MKELRASDIIHLDLKVFVILTRLNMKLGMSKEEAQEQTLKEMKERLQKGD